MREEEREQEKELDLSAESEEKPEEESVEENKSNTKSGWVYKHPIDRVLEAHTIHTDPDVDPERMPIETKESLKFVNDNALKERDRRENTVLKNLGRGLLAILVFGICLAIGYGIAIWLGGFSSGVAEAWDANGDGIVQVEEVSDYLNEVMSDTMVLGVSLSTLIAFAINLLGLLIVWLKQRKVNAASQQVVSEAKTSVDTISAELATTRQEYAEYVSKSQEREAQLLEALEKSTAETRKLQQSYHADSATLSKSLEDSAKAIQDSALQKRQLSATLQAVQALADTPENIQNGVAGRINRIVEEAKSVQQ